MLDLRLSFKHSTSDIHYQYRRRRRSPTSTQEQISIREEPRLPVRAPRYRSRRAGAANSSLEAWSKRRPTHFILHTNATRTHMGSSCIRIRHVHLPIRTRPLSGRPLFSSSGLFVFCAVMQTLGWMQCSLSRLLPCNSGSQHSVSQRQC